MCKLCPSREMFMNGVDVTGCGVQQGSPRHSVTDEPLTYVAVTISR